MNHPPSLKTHSAASLLLGAAFLFLTALVPGPLRAEESTPPSLVIFHTNDVHGYALPVRDQAGNLTHLGYDRMKAYIDGVEADNKLLLDAGDVLHGQPFATARRGEFIARLLAILQYDALAVGNHDFDYGLERLLELRDRYGLNFIAANILKKDDEKPLLPPYIIKDFGDFKVGVFGLSTPDTPIKTAPGNVKAVSFSTPEEVVRIARETTEHLKTKEGVDLVVAVTHLGADPLDNPGSQAVARGAPGLDLVIDGHSHSKLAGLRAGDALIVSTGSYLENLGQVTVTRTPEGRLILAPRLIPAVEFGSVAPDPRLAALTEELSAELEKELAQVMGHTPIDLNGDRERVRQASTNLGRVICAALMAATGADAALFNGGSIRASIPAGDITRGQVLSVLPYGNYVLTVRLTGAEVLEALTVGLGQPAEGGFPQFYGLTVTAAETKKYAPDGTITLSYRPAEVKIGGRLLDEKAQYTIAINDFMFAGGDGYTVFGRSVACEYATVEEILRNFLATVDRATLDAIDRAEVLTVISAEKAAK